MEITNLGPTSRGWEDAEAYRQTQAKWAPIEQSAIALALMQEELRKAEDERRIRSAALDMLQGYGTPGERSEELYRPTSGVGAALRGGGVMSNITPEGGYTVTGQEGVEPVPGMRDIQRPTGDVTRNALMRKALLGSTGELPEEKFAREQALQKERIELGEKGLQSREDIAALRAEGAEKRTQAWREIAAEKADVGAKRSLMVQFAGNRANDIARREQLAEAARAKVQSQYMNAAVTGGLQLPGAQEMWTKTLEQAEGNYNRLMVQYQKEREIVQAQVTSLMGELGISKPEQVAKPTVDPVAEVNTIMRRKMEPSHYGMLTSSGVDAAFILRRAQERGNTPEEYINALIEARNNEIKLGTGKEELTVLSGEQMQEKWKARGKTLTPSKPKARTLGERWKASRSPEGKF